MATALASTGETDGLGARSPRLTRRLWFDRAMRWLLPLTFLLVLLPLFDLLYYIGAKALPTFTLQTLTTNPIGLGGGLYAPIVGTLVLIGIATAFASTVGIVAGMYTAEFAPSSIARAARLGGNLLAGVPAIVVGYFGYFLLVLATGWKFSTLGGGLTLGVFMIPYVYRVCDLALARVPGEQREGALATGARRGQYLLRVALPIALPSILTGIFLAMAIGLGETAPLVLTAGWSNTPVQSLLAPTSYLTGVVYENYQFPSNLGQLVTLAFQAAFLLVVIVLALNVVVQLIADHYRRRLRGLF
jgi:phosphate transport system permease protein